MQCDKLCKVALACFCKSDGSSWLVLKAKCVEYALFELMPAEMSVWEVGVDLVIKYDAVTHTFPGIHLSQDGAALGIPVKWQKCDAAFARLMTQRGDLVWTLIRRWKSPNLL